MITTASLFLVPSALWNDERTKAVMVDSRLMEDERPEKDDSSGPTISIRLLSVVDEVSSSSRLKARGRVQPFPDSEV